MTSISSKMSMMSVSHRGDEVPLEEALDEIFRELQSNLNDTHCLMREIAMSEEQDNDFKEICKQCWDVESNIDGMHGLFKELKSVLKQVRGPIPAAEKQWVESQLAMKKQEIINEKLRIKNEEQHKNTN